MATNDTPGARRRNLAPADGASDLPPEPPDAGRESADLIRWEEDEKINDIVNNEENAGSKLEFYRRDQTGKWAYITVLSLEDWTPEARQNIAQEFGGGDYRARVRKQGGSFGQSFNFSIDRAVRPLSAAGDRAPSELLELVRMNKAGQPDMFAFLMQQMQAQQQAALAAQQQQMQLIVAAMGRPAPAGPSEKIMEILLTKSLQPAPSLDLSKLIGALKDLKEMAGLNGRGGREGGGREAPAARDDGFWSAIMGQLPALLGAITQAGLMPGAQPGLPSAPAAVAPLPPPESLRVAAPVETPLTVATVPPAAPAAEPDPLAAKAADNRAALSALMEAMIKQAQAGTDPLAAAVQLSEALDDENYTALAVVLQRSDWLALLADAHEGVMMQTPWMLKWRERLLAELETEDAPS